MGHNINKKIQHEVQIMHHNPIKSHCLKWLFLMLQKKKKS